MSDIILSAAQMDSYGIWTSHQLDTCIVLWREGHPSRIIAQRIGKSRNAVLGKMHRLGIQLGQPAPKPILSGLTMPEPPKPAPPLPPPNYSAVLCGCGATNQPGRGLCNRCLTKRQKPNSRADMFVGFGDAA